MKLLFWIGILFAAASVPLHLLAQNYHAAGWAVTTILLAITVLQKL